LVLAGLEVCAAATIDPEAAIVDVPGLAADAGRSANLPDETNFASGTNVTPVSSSVVGGAGDGDGRRLRFKATNEEVCAAATVDPEAALIDAPGVVLDTGRATDLSRHADVAIARGADVAPVSVSIVGGAGDGDGRRWRLPATDNELGAAAAVDPEATAVDSPGVVPDAGGAADLSDQTDVARGADIAPVSAAVVGGAGNPGAWSAVIRLRDRGGGCGAGAGDKKGGCQEELGCALHLALFSSLKIVTGP
jgi:hypothetical protein